MCFRNSKLIQALLASVIVAATVNWIVSATAPCSRHSETAA